MYHYDSASTRGSGCAFDIEYVTPRQNVQALKNLYYCDAVDHVISGSELTEEIDSYYCPNCLENLPSREAFVRGLRCPKCYDCPACFSTLGVVQTTSLSRGTTYCFSCSNCLWNSAGGPQQVVLNTKEAEFLGSSSSNDKPSSASSNTAGCSAGTKSGDEKQSGSDGEGKTGGGTSDVLLQGQHPLLHMAVPEDLGRNLLAIEDRSSWRDDFVGLMRRYKGVAQNAALRREMTEKIQQQQGASAEALLSQLRHGGDLDMYQPSSTSDASKNVRNRRPRQGRWQIGDAELELQEKRDLQETFAIEYEEVARRRGEYEELGVFNSPVVNINNARNNLGTDANATENTDTGANTGSNAAAEGVSGSNEAAAAAAAPDAPLGNNINAETCVRQTLMDVLDDYAVGDWGRAYMRKEKKRRLREDKELRKLVRNLKKFATSDGREPTVETAAEKEKRLQKKQKMLERKAEREAEEGVKGSSATGGGGGTAGGTAGTSNTKTNAAVAENLFVLQQSERSARVSVPPDPALKVRRLMQEKSDRREGIVGGKPGIGKDLFGAAAGNSSGDSSSASNTALSPDDPGLFDSLFANNRSVQDRKVEIMENRKGGSRSFPPAYNSGGLMAEAAKQATNEAGNDYTGDQDMTDPGTQGPTTFGDQLLDSERFVGVSDGVPLSKRFQEQIDIQTGKKHYEISPSEEERELQKLLQERELAEARTRAQEAWRHRPRVWRSLDLLEWEKADIGGRMGRLGTWYFDDLNYANYGRVLSDKLKPSVEITKGRDRKGNDTELETVGRVKVFRGSTHCVDEAATGTPQTSLLSSQDQKVGPEEQVFPVRYVSPEAFVAGLENALVGDLENSNHNAQNKNASSLENKNDASSSSLENKNEAADAGADAGKATAADEKIAEATKEGDATEEQLRKELTRKSYSILQLADLDQTTQQIGNRSVGNSERSTSYNISSSSTMGLLPLRKPLLTKRSKRCSYSGRIVVKPQINPCSLPPFQKENSAPKFIPRVQFSVRKTVVDVMDSWKEKVGRELKKAKKMGTQANAALVPTAMPTLPQTFTEGAGLIRRWMFGEHAETNADDRGDNKEDMTLDRHVNVYLTISNPMACDVDVELFEFFPPPSYEDHMASYGGPAARGSGARSRRGSLGGNATGNSANANVGEADDTGNTDNNALAASSASREQNIAAAMYSNMLDGSQHWTSRILSPTAEFDVSRELWRPLELPNCQVIRNLTGTGGVNPDTDPSASATSSSNNVQDSSTRYLGKIRLLPATDEALATDDDSRAIADQRGKDPPIVIDRRGQKVLLRLVMGASSAAVKAYRGAAAGNRGGNANNANGGTGSAAAANSTAANSNREGSHNMSQPQRLDGGDSENVDGVDNANASANATDPLDAQRDAMAASLLPQPVSTGMPLGFAGPAGDPTAGSSSSSSSSSSSNAVGAGAASGSGGANSVGANSGGANDPSNSDPTNNPNDLTTDALFSDLAPHHATTPILFYLEMRCSYTDTQNKPHTVTVPIRCRI